MQWSFAAVRAEITNFSHHQLMAVQLQDLVHLCALDDDALHAARVANEQREAIPHEAKAHVHFVGPSSSGT